MMIIPIFRSKTLFRQLNWIGPLSTFSVPSPDAKCVDAAHRNKIDDEMELLVNPPLNDQRKLVLRTPTGTRDIGPKQNTVRSAVLAKIKHIFKLHGGAEIDTPVFELKEILTGKYGNDSKLIYDLKDQGSEILSLRYDLTVPFARYLAMNKISSCKRYQIAKVYRRDKPKVARGRFREFYQCDFDIAGKHEGMIADAECLKILAEVMNAIDIGEYLIKVNHRQLLDGILEICGAPTARFQDICSSIDKLDKTSWAEVCAEMINEKHINTTVVDKIGEYVHLNGGNELIQRLRGDNKLIQLRNASLALDDMENLLDFCNIIGIGKNVSFDLSLARGLDYYTGVIYECVLRNDRAPEANRHNSSENSTIGSIAGGGRYDNLVGIFDVKNNSVPCVGVSIGIERIFALIESKLDAENTTPSSNGVQVYVATLQRNLYKERLRLVNMLWENGIRAEHPYKLNPRLLDQLQYCEQNGVPLAITIGPKELAEGKVLLRNVTARKEAAVSITELVNEIKKQLNCL